MLQFPPRFVPDLSFGFGYPLFTFVYPLPFYIAEIFHLIGFSLVNSVKLVFGLSIPFSMFFMYKLLKNYLTEELSLAGAVLYIYAPYRALEIFVRGTIGEIVAFVFFPLIILSFIKLTESNFSKKWIGIAGVSTAALILSHNIMAYMFIPFLIIFVIARIVWISKEKKEAILNTFKGLFLGLLSSIYFWFPAISESGLMHYSTVFNFYDHFPALKQFITPYWGYGASVPGNYDTMSFYMGLVGLIVVILGFGVFLSKIKKFSKNEKIFVGWGVFVFSLSVFMMNFRSVYLWRTLPLLPYFQFPWRFIAMTTLVSPLFLIGFSKFPSKLMKIISLIIIFLAILLNFNYFKTSEYLGRMDDYYIDRFIPVPVASEAYKKTSEEYLRLPVNNEIRPNENYPRAFTDDNSVNIEIRETNALNAKIVTHSDNEFILNYNKYYYPGFIAKIDGELVEITPGRPFGQISFVVPGGSHIVDVVYRESPNRLIFDLVSLVTISYSIFLILRKNK
ncbi:MAG: glycosyltransferase family 39 protein [bacterium]|nr:glycosyltransferase family 39 protein [bacterium]